MSNSRMLTIMVLALAWHLFTLLVPPDVGRSALEDTLGRDFASYYYAARVAATDGDPYDTEALSAAARADGTRDEVHPFFYPPPYILLVAWAPKVDLKTGYDLWYWLQEAALIVAMLALWWWWRPLGRSTPAAIAAWVALLWGVPYGHVMGQTNCIVLMLVILALWQDDEDRQPLAGILMGLACMWKMSPALFVVWWLLRGRWVAAWSSVGAAVALSVITLPFVGWDIQREFYTEVMPAFANGDYNGLVLQIDMFGNHSLPNLIDQIMPSRDEVLSENAQSLSSVLGLVILGGLGWFFQDPPRDAFTRHAQVSAVAATSLLIPVYTYEHHLVWLLPGLALITVAVVEKRLPWWVAYLLGFSAVALAFPLPWLKSLATHQFADAGPMPWVLQEAKFLALVFVVVTSAWLGNSLVKEEEEEESDAQRA